MIAAVLIVSIIFISNQEGILSLAGEDLNKTLVSVIDIGFETTFDGALVARIVIPVIDPDQNFKLDFIDQFEISFIILYLDTIRQSDEFRGNCPVRGFG
jgi:hypothetical protein